MKIKNGPIYKYYGTTVRAITLASNGMRVVQTAEMLNGFARDEDLEIAKTDEVDSYLNRVHDFHQKYKRA